MKKRLTKKEKAELERWQREREGKLTREDFENEEREEQIGEKERKQRSIDDIYDVGKRAHIAEEYLDSAMDLSDALFQTRKRYYSPEKVIETAVFLQDLYETAYQSGIKPKYIDEQVKERYRPLRSPSRSYALPNLGRMGGKEIRRIINKAIEMQERDVRKKRLESEAVTVTIIFGMILSGLFFLSSNITGNVIGNLANSTSNIIGGILFAGGLVTLFFLTKRKE